MEADYLLFDTALEAEEEYLAAFIERAIEPVADSGAEGSEEEYLELFMAHSMEEPETFLNVMSSLAAESGQMCIRDSYDLGVQLLALFGGHGGCTGGAVLVVEILQIKAHGRDAAVIHSRAEGADGDEEAVLALEEVIGLESRVEVAGALTNYAGHGVGRIGSAQDVYKRQPHAPCPSTGGAWGRRALSALLELLRGYLRAAVKADGVLRVDFTLLGKDVYKRQPSHPFR